MKKLPPSATDSSTSSSSSIALNDLSVSVASSFAPLAAQTKGADVSLHQPAAAAAAAAVTVKPAQETGHDRKQQEQEEKKQVSTTAQVHTTQSFTRARPV